MLAQAAHDHAIAAVVATANIVLAVTGLALEVVGAEVNDSVLAGAVLFTLGTGVGIMGWALVVLVRLTGEVASLQAAREEHERRLESGGL